MSRWTSNRQPFIRQIAGLSKGLVEEPRYLTQPNDVTCVHTCLAMVTGIPIEDIIYAFGDHRGLTHHDQKALLGLCGIRYTPVPDTNSFSHGISLGTIQSLNHKNTTHRIVIIKDIINHTVRILDPNRMKKGKKVFTKSMLYRHTIFGILYLERGLMYIPGPTV